MECHEWNDIPTNVQRESVYRHVFTDIGVSADVANNTHAYTGIQLLGYKLRSCILDPQWTLLQVIFYLGTENVTLSFRDHFASTSQTTTSVNLTHSKQILIKSQASNHANCANLLTLKVRSGRPPQDSLVGDRVTFCHSIEIKNLPRVVTWILIDVTNAEDLLLTSNTWLSGGKPKA